MSADYSKPIVKIKSIYRPKRTIHYKGHKIVVKYKRDKIEVYKCKQCNFKHLNLEKDGKYLKSHLTKIHQFHFIKGHSQQVKVQNTILVLNQFDYVVSKELFWICPFCAKKFIHTPLYNDYEGKDYKIEQSQMIKHFQFCPKMTKNCTKKQS